MQGLIDSHCHLTAPQFALDVNDVIARARAAGVSPMVTIAESADDLAPCRALAESNNDIFFTAGIHPHHAAAFRADADKALLRSMADSDRCRGIGEIGLDYHYMHSPKDVQMAAFEVQLRLAKELHLPAVVHCRDAVEDVWRIVDLVRPQKMVIHCCTEAWSDVERFVDAGYFLSFTGILTFPASHVVRDTAVRCPLQQLMVGTDAPFLAPVPHRGKRCEPAYVVDTAKALATLRGISIEELDTQTTRNAVEFFRLCP